MIQRALLTSLVVVGLAAVASQPASAQPGWRRPHGFYGYYGYGRPVVVPPPVVIAPGYSYGVAAYPPSPAYVAPLAPVPAIPPAPIVVPPPPPVYVPSYTYGVIGSRRGFGFGYSSPGFGVYLGR